MCNTHGLSRRALGNTAEPTGQTVANIEVQGMSPRVDTVEMLAKALGVSASSLAFEFSENTSQASAVAPQPPDNP